MVRSRLAGHGDAVLGLRAHDPAHRHTTSLAVIHRRTALYDRAQRRAPGRHVRLRRPGMPDVREAPAAERRAGRASRPPTARPGPDRRGRHPSYAAHAPSPAARDRAGRPRRGPRTATWSTSPCTRRSVTGGPPWTQRSGTVDEDTTTTARHRAASTHPIVCASSPPLENRSAPAHADPRRSLAAPLSMTASR